VTTADLTQTTRRGSTAPREILEATQAILLREGVEGLSIRRVSERCGYSAPTIYHHFGDKRGLVDALLEERFRVAYEVMSAIPEGGDPAGHLREMSRAFIAFARENPGHYRLLMEPGLRGPEPIPSADAARALVREDLEELSRRGSLATSDIDAAFHVLWAMLHGLISLEISRAVEDIPRGLDELTFEVVEAGLLLRKDAR
jgi:AcrR family transcriptional regulator